MLSLPFHPAQGRQDGASSPSPSPGLESFYSTRDIEILHHVVVTAQEELATLPEGERLATNALFRAYDHVLPLYGLDPEHDHHLSRLVFRIGGERGSGPLLEKFKAVLSRMGIELQIEVDGQTTSSEASTDTDSELKPSSAAPDAQQIAGHDYFPHPPPHFDEADRLPLNHSSHILNADHRPKQAVGADVAISDKARQNARPSRAVSPGADQAVSSRDQTEIQHINQTTYQASAIPGDTAAVRDQSHISAIDDMAQQNTSRSGSGTSSLIMKARPLTLGQGPLDREQLQGISTASRSHPGQDNGHQSQHLAPASQETACHQGPVDSQLDAFLSEDMSHLRRLSSRAWGLFQLTKAVSHWYVWTEEKLDRAAIARRHMARFRHFGQWHNNTAGAKEYGNRLRMSRACKAWAQSAEQTERNQIRITRCASTYTLRATLERWYFSALDDSNLASQARTSAGLNLCSQRWLEQAHSIQNRVRQADDAARTVLVITTLTTWLRSTRSAGTIERSFRRQNILGCLSVWELASKSHGFQMKLSKARLSTFIENWSSLAQAPFSSRRQSTFYDRRGAEVIIRRADGPRALITVSRRSLIGRTIGTWRRMTGHIASANEGAGNLLVCRNIRQGLLAWYDSVAEADERSLWARRAQHYLTISTYLQKARQLARPPWSHTTRTLYARARWKQKHLNARRVLSTWRTEARTNSRQIQAAQSREVDLSAHRLILTLHAWQEECQGLMSLDWPSHVPNTWLNEWAVSEESLRLLQDEATAAWDGSLKSRVYNRWRTFSVQFHSQIYIVTDVLEKSTRKSTRRILLHWHGRASPLVHPSSNPLSSLNANTSRGPGSSLWSRGQSGPTAASSLMDLGERGWPERVEEENEREEGSIGSENGGHAGLLNTPTRWTGLSRSLMRLPTTTPLAPLPTPFERELRGRSSQALLPQVLSERYPARGTPRLSKSDARRIAEERRYKRPI